MDSSLALGCLKDSYTPGRSPDFIHRSVGRFPVSELSGVLKASVVVAQSCPVCVSEYIRFPYTTFG